MSQHDAPSRVRPVVVIGAGPIGLSAALALRYEGLPVTVLEAGAADRSRPGSRAIFLHRESLEHLDRFSPGLGWRIADHGLVWSTKRTFWGERQVYERTYGPPDPRVLPPSTNLAQTATEGFLAEACQSAGVEFAWDQAIAEVKTSAEGVCLRTEADVEWKAEYVIAADGARSTVRRSLGITMEGGRSENAFVIVDVAEDDEAPQRPERLYYYEHPAVDGRHVLLVPFAGGWRADLQCRPDDDADRFADPDGVRRWVSRVLPERYADRITWVSTYRFLQVVSESFVDANRRVLLIGEAAHLFAPFGARGMNSGIPDAGAAARAVRQALESPGSARGPLDTFNASRRAAALYNRDAAGLALTHMQARGTRTRVKRRVAVWAARAGTRAGRWLDSAPYGPRSRAGDTGGTY